MLCKSLLAGVAMAAALAVLTGTAEAKGMKEFHRTDAWVSYAGINDDGHPQCVTSTDSSIGVMLKFDTSHPDELLIHLATSSWKIPNGTAIRVQLQVDDAPGRVYEAKGDGDGVAIAFKPDDTDSVTGEPSIRLLDNLLKTGQTLKVTFPDGKEGLWRASLNGSAAEFGQFSTCIDTVKTALASKKAQRDAEERATAAQRLIDTQKRAAELEAQARSATAQAQQDRERVEAQAQQEKERAAEEARRQIQAQAVHEKLIARLKELGFELIGSVDLNLDWKSYLTNGTKIAIDGTYVEDSDVEVLSTPDNKDQPRIRIYTDNASRDARKLMLECRNSDFKFSSCQMVVGGTIKNCTRNQGKLNEKEVPCIRVQEAYLKS